MFIMLIKIGNLNNFINEMFDYYYNIIEYVKNLLI